MYLLNGPFEPVFSSLTYDFRRWRKKGLTVKKIAILNITGLLQMWYEHFAKLTAVLSPETEGRGLETVFQKKRQ